MSTKKISQQGKVPSVPASAGSSNNVAVPKALQASQFETPPQWARSIIDMIGNLNSRIDQMEVGGNPPSINEAASEVSDGGVGIHQPPPQNVGTANAWQQVQRPKAPMGPPQPKMGESGSGYTLLPNGKMVRNKRPAHKPLPVRQAINWRSNATTELVSFLKEKGIGKSDPKPIDDPRYNHLVENLAKAKAYYAYTKVGGTQQVHVWREANKDVPFASHLEDDTQSWADEMNSQAEAQNVLPGQLPGIEPTGSKGKQPVREKSPSEILASSSASQGNGPAGPGDVRPQSANGTNRQTVIPASDESWKRNFPQAK